MTARPRIIIYECDLQRCPATRGWRWKRQCLALAAGHRDWIRELR